jgi:rod shape-determining protein MreC
VTRYQKQRPVSLAAVLIVIVIVLSVAFSRDLFGIRPLAASMAYPFQYAGLAIWKTVIGTPSFIINIKNLATENQKLIKELESANANLLSLEELKTENARLRIELNYSARGAYNSRLIPAQVIGRTPSSWPSVLQIALGKTTVKIGVPVISIDGLVGQVIELSPLEAKVLLLTDATSRVAGADQRSRAMGVIEGDGTSRLWMKFVPADADIRVGDKIVTSGLSTFAPSGIPIGIVTAVHKNDFDMFYRIEVHPLADLSSLEEVFVVQ